MTMKMRVLYTGLDMGSVESTEYDIVVGPCPGCDLWQVDYSRRVSNAMSDFHAVLEGVLAEHLRECWHLQALVPNWEQYV